MTLFFHLFPSPFARLLRGTDIKGLDTNGYRKVHSEFLGISDGYTTSHKLPESKTLITILGIAQIQKFFPSNLLPMWIIGVLIIARLESFADRLLS